MKRSRVFRVIWLAVAAGVVLLPGCRRPGAVVSFTVGGVISGLTANGLVLSFNGGETMEVEPGSGEFRFRRALPDGENYKVAVETQPGSGAQTCTVRNASGCIEGALVKNVDIIAETDFTALFEEVSTVFPPLQTNSSSSFGDVDGDGDLDLVLTGNSGGQFAALYLNDGSGDLDLDGDLDLIISGFGGGSSATVYINDGRGNFTNAEIGLPGYREGSLSLGDIDGDGDLDMILNGEDFDLEPTTILYRNNLN